MSQLLQIFIIFFVIYIGLNEAAEVEICRENLIKHLDQCLSGGFELERPVPCTIPLINVSVCLKTFDISVVEVVPYSSTIFPSLLQMILGTCCGDCYKSRTLISYPSAEGFAENIQFKNNTKPHFVYPVLNERGSEEMHGYHFIPMVDLPTSYYFTKKPDSSTTIKALVDACLDLWPLLLVTILMAFVAGFIAWIMDTWNNIIEFPRGFFPGVFHGFWWSFVSMTTVGYGDKSPKSWYTRSFAVLWILIGITICSMFTASLTTAITEASVPPTPKMSGQKVGILPNRLYDLSFVIKAGGIAIADELEGLIKKLENEDIEGFVMDAYTALYYQKDKKLNFKLENYIITEKIYAGDKLVYGALITHNEDFEYLRSFMQYNKLLLETCITGSIGAKNVVNAESTNIFATKSGLFLPSCLALVGLIISILIFGLIYEKTRKKKMRGSSVSSMVLGSSIDIPKTDDLKLRTISEMRKSITGIQNNGYADEKC